MNRFAAAHPEDWEERLDQMTDLADMDHDDEPFADREPEPCPQCGNALTMGGARCARCRAENEDEASRHVPGRD